MKQELKKRINNWTAENPDRVYAGQQMLSQLFTIENELKGPEKENLLYLVEEGLDRIEELEMAKVDFPFLVDSLSESLQSIVSTTVDCLEQLSSITKSQPVVPANRAVKNLRLN